MLRFALAAVFTAVLTAVLGGPAILLALARRDGAARSVTRAWALGILWLGGVKVEVAGVSNLPAGPAVYAANHTSVLDIPILFACLPVDFRIVHKRSLFAVPVLGSYLWVAGHIAIDRGSAWQSRRSYGRAAKRIRSGTSVVMFPEGTRSRTGGVGPFKRGSLLVAVETGAPVVPLSLSGVRPILPGGPVLRPGRVLLTVHPPVPTATLTPDGVGELAERVRCIVATACEAA